MKWYAWIVSQTRSHFSTRVIEMLCGAAACSKDLFSHLTWPNVSSNLTLLGGGRARTLAVIGPFLGCVLHVFWTGVCRCYPLLVAIVTLGRLGSQALLRLAQLESDLPVLFLHLSNPRCQDVPFQQPCFCGFHQACGEEQGTPVWYGTTDLI